MDTINLVAVLTGIGDIGVYLALDYTVSIQSRRLAESISQRQDVLELDRQQHNLFQNGVDRIVSVIGPFTYFAKKYYRNAVR